MRLSEWRKAAPSKESLGSPVLGVLKPVLLDLGAEADPECWVLWGDDPSLRYSVLAPTIAGLITVAVRLSGPDEGPRATGRLIRWPKLSVSELGVEASGEHRIVAVQVESLVLKGTDEEADRICEFVRGLIAGIDGRNPVPIPITVVQGAAAAGAVVVAAPEAAVQASGPTEAGAIPERPAAVPRLPAPAGPIARPAREAAPSDPALSMVPVAAPPARPAAPPAAPNPIVARADAVQPGARPSPGPDLPAHESSEREPERPAPISPHPSEKLPVREPKRPRPWTP